jgi:hypothetical protein
MTRSDAARAAQRQGGAVEDEMVGQTRVRIGVGFIIVDGVRPLRVIGIGSGSDRRNVEQVHHPLVVLFRREMRRRR